MWVRRIWTSKKFYTVIDSHPNASRKVSIAKTTNPLHWYVCQDGGQEGAIVKLSCPWSQN